MFVQVPAMIRSAFYGGRYYQQPPALATIYWLVRMSFINSQQGLISHRIVVSTTHWSFTLGIIHSHVIHTYIPGMSSVIAPGRTSAESIKQYSKLCFNVSQGGQARIRGGTWLQRVFSLFLRCSIISLLLHPPPPIHPTRPWSMTTLTGSPDKILQWVTGVVRQLNPWSAHPPWPQDRAIQSFKVLVAPPLPCQQRKQRQGRYTATIWEHHQNIPLHPAQFFMGFWCLSRITWIISTIPLFLTYQLIYLVGNLNCGISRTKAVEEQPVA